MMRKSCSLFIALLSSAPGSSTALYAGSLEREKCPSAVDACSFCSSSSCGGAADTLRSCTGQCFSEALSRCSSATTAALGGTPDFFAGVRHRECELNYCNNQYLDRWRTCAGDSGCSTTSCGVEASTPVCLGDSETNAYCSSGLSTSCNCISCNHWLQEYFDCVDNVGGCSMPCNERQPLETLGPTTPTPPPTKSPNMRPTSRPTNRPTSRPTNRPTNRPTSQPTTSRPTDRSTPVETVTNAGSSSDDGQEPSDSPTSESTANVVGSNNQTTEKLSSVSSASVPSCGFSVALVVGFALGTLSFNL